MARAADADLRKFYFEVKRDIALDVLRYDPGDLAMMTSDCDGGGADVYGDYAKPDTQRGRLIFLAFDVLHIKRVLKDVPTSLWKDTLIEAEDDALTDIGRGRKVVGIPASIEDRIAARVNTWGSANLENWMQIDGYHPGECGGDLTRVRFSDYVGRLQYMPSTIYQICNRSSDLEPGYCDWADYKDTEEGIGLHGTIELRIAGSAEEPQFFPLEDHLQATDEDVIVIPLGMK